MGWADPGLPVDDDYCGVAVDWIAPSECEEMECGRCIGALSPSHCGALFIKCIQSMGALSMVRVAIVFHFVWLSLETFAALLPTRGT
jgi:hypothetical protein